MLGYVICEPAVEENTGRLQNLLVHSRNDLIIKRQTGCQQFWV